IAEVTYTYDGAQWTLSTGADILTLEGDLAFRFASTVNYDHPLETWTTVLASATEGTAHHWTLTFDDGNEMLVTNVTPVPAPTSAVLFLAGIAAVPLIARRQRRTAN